MRTVVELQQHGGVEAGGAQHLHGPRVEVALDRDAAQAVDPREPPVLGPVVIERLQAGTQVSGAQRSPTTQFQGLGGRVS